MDGKMYNFTETNDRKINLNIYASYNILQTNKYSYIPNINYTKIIQSFLEVYYLLIREIK